MKELFTNMGNEVLAMKVEKKQNFSESVAVLQTFMLTYCSRMIAFPEQLSKCPVLLYWSER